MRHRPGVAEAAWKGAVAGLAGGAALLAARELEERGLLPGDEPGPRRRRPGPTTRRRLRRAARERGVALSARESAMLDVGAQLAGAAAVGAVYGLVRRQVRLPAAASGALLGALAYGGTTWGVLPAAGLLAGPPGGSLRDALAPAGTHAVFGMVTARVFDWMADMDD